MSNREIVQEGLDRRATARRQRMTEAAHEATERHMREMVNTKTQERREATEAAQRQAEAEMAEQQRKAERREAHKAQEAAWIAAWNAYMCRIFGSVIVAALICFCYLHDGMAYWTAFPCIAGALVYSIATFVKYTVMVTKVRW